MIPPIPKEYITYSNQEMNRRTEIYYQKIADLYCRMDASKEEYRKRLDFLLYNNVTSVELFKVLSEKEAQILSLYEYDYYCLKVLCDIAEKEELFNEPSVLQNVHNIDDAVYWQKKCVFLLRRFEFGREEDDELLLYVRQKKVSYIFMAELICGNSIVRKVHTACVVAKFLAQNGITREAVLLLMWLEKQLPYSERLIMMFSMTLLDMGERKLAYEILMKHRKPDSDIKELQIMLAEMQ